MDVKGRGGGGVESEPHTFESRCEGPSNEIHLGGPGPMGKAFRRKQPGWWADACRANELSYLS